MAAQPEVLTTLPDEDITELREALAHRLGDARADLRERLAAGYALGAIGDPRFERADGPHGPYLVPPLVEVPGGEYPIGMDEPIEWSGGTIRTHVSRHTVSVEPFSIGRYPVTNAEWARFIQSGGYDEERWWTTDASKAWRRGENTSAGIIENVLRWLEDFKAQPELVEELYQRGSWREEVYERWRRRLEMTQDEVQAHLDELYPSHRLTEPRFWRDSRFNAPNQPVVGISWVEALAYAHGSRRSPVPCSAFRQRSRSRPPHGGWRADPMPSATNSALC